MAQVTVDPDKIKGVNLANVDPGDIDKLMFETAERVTEEAEAEDETLTLAALGGGYQVGPIDITVALGNIVLLHQINSPFISGEVGKDGEELETVECFKALYVLAKGKEAIRPIMAIKQRIQNLLRLETMCKGNPELFEKLMDRVEQVSESEKDFEEAATDWYQENFVGYDFQETINAIFLALGDVMKASEDLPTGADDEKKK